jgi:hypothetical protein
MTVNDVTQRKEKGYRRNGEQRCKARAEGWCVVTVTNGGTAILRGNGGQRFLGNRVPLFLWQRFSDVIRRHITAAGLRYRYPRKP